jgi:hypothetical protein
MTRLFYLSGLALLFALVLGCSGIGNSPASPRPIDLQSNQASVQQNGRILWGLWHVDIDPVTLYAQVTPLRGVQFNANVTQFLQPPFSKTNMLSFKINPGSTPSTGYFEVDVIIKHPFPGLNQYRGFDVRGILIADGSVQGNHDSSLTYAGEDETHLVNADGWTRWWNPTEFTSFNSIFGFTSGKLAPMVKPSATLNGYKYYADELSTTGDISTLDISQRGSFGAYPGINTRQFNIQFAMSGGKPVLSFNYAVDAGWSEPDPAFKPAYPIEAFNYSANCQEAYSLNCGFDGSTAYYIDSSDNGGDIHASLEIGDWQALKTSGNVASEVSSIWVESNSLGIAPVQILPSAIVSGGNGVTSSVYTFDITGVQPSGLANQTILVSVVASSPSDYAPQIDGSGSFAYPQAPLTAYKFFNVPILGSQPNTTPAVISIAPIYGALDSSNLPAVITGQDFKQNATAQLVKNDAPGVILGATIQSVSPDGTTINCTFNMDTSSGAELGTYDVKVTNPGPPTLSGLLDDGFTIYPKSTCSEVYKDQLYSGSFANYIDYMNDLAFTKDGLLLHRVKVGAEYDLYGFDVSENDVAPGTLIVQNMQGGTNSVFSIDVDDQTGNIIYAVGTANGNAVNNTLYIYKRDGTYVGNIVNQNTDHLTCVDTDSDGSIWTIGHTFVNPGGSPPDYGISKYFIDHYKYNASDGSYSYDASGSIDATSKLYTYYWPTIFDCAISYTNHRMLIYSYGTNYLGALDIYDLSSGTPVWVKKVTNIFLSSQIGGLNGAANGNWLYSDDIEIDHSNPVAESCRIVVIGHNNAQGYGQAVVKLDEDGNKLDTWWNPSANSEHRLFTSCAINPVYDDPDGSYLTCNEFFVYITGNQFYTFKMPTGW